MACKNTLKVNSYNTHKQQKELKSELETNTSPINS